MLIAIEGFRYPTKLLIRVLKDGSKGRGAFAHASKTALRIVRHPHFFRTLLAAGVLFDALHCYLQWRHAVDVEGLIGSGSVGLLALNECCEIFRG